MSLPAYHHPAGQSNNDEWATPPSLFAHYDRIYNFDLDVCATSENAKCADFYTKERDGLLHDWEGARCWMNPPYSDIRAWVKKAYDESCCGALVVCLVPSRTGTAWFHDYAVRGRLEFLRGRVKFGGAGFAPFDSLVVTFFPGDDQLPLFAWDAA